MDTTNKEDKCDHCKYLKSSSLIMYCGKLKVEMPNGYAVKHCSEICDKEEYQPKISKIPWIVIFGLILFWLLIAWLSTLK